MLTIQSNGRFNGQIALVTGGASGIGQACAELLASEGAKVVIADVNIGQANEVAQIVGGYPFEIDVSDETKVEDLAKKIEAELGVVTLLINSAGIVQGSAVPPADLSMEIFDRIFQVNLRGIYNVCNTFGSRMAKHGAGSILNVASISGMLSTPLHAYGPMKAAVIQLTSNLAAEWGQLGVRVNCISPGPVLTPAMQASVDAGLRSLNLMEQSTATGKMVLPLDVALAAAFLLSEQASAITGVNLPVDNGWILAGSWSMFGGVKRVSK